MFKSSIVSAIVITLALATVSQAAVITGVTIQDVSSQLTEHYSRPAVNTVNAPGLDIISDYSPPPLI
jgi:hypothetical protein